MKLSAALNALLILTVIGCSEKESCVHGKVELSPAGHPIVLPGSYRYANISDATAGYLVDLRVEEWIREKAEWGLAGYQDEILARTARAYPILLFDSDTTPMFGGSGGNKFGCHLEIALWTLKDGLYMGSLPHELTHSLLLHFH